MDIKKDISTIGKVTAINTFLLATTGKPAEIKYSKDNDFVRIVLNEQQKIILQNEIEKQLRAKPGKIRFNYSGVILPPLIKVYGKFAVGALVISFLLGATFNND